jgi:hypothetical protein
MNRVNKVLIGTDIARTLLMVTQGADQLIAAGEIFVADKNKNVLTAGATIADSDIIYIGQASATTFDYALPDGTAVPAEKKVEFSAPIQGSLIKSYKGVVADSAPTERVITIKFDTDSTVPVVGIEYVLRVVYKDIPEHPGQFTDTFRVIATGTTGASLCVQFKNEINTDPNTRVLATGTTDLVLTGKVIPNSTIDEYSQVDFDVFLMSDNFSPVPTVADTAFAHPGNGNPKIIRDREKFALGYEGITNRTHFPVISPLQSVVMTEWYDSIIIENGIYFTSSDMEYVKEAQVTTEIYIPTGAGQTTDILEVLNPWFESCPGAFSNITI